MVRRFLVFISLLCSTTSAWSADTPLDGVDPGPLVVHEWGTFTSFSGSDAVKLEFRPLTDADLPPFVVDRALQSGHMTGRNKLTLSVLQRMETPVTYFYSDSIRQLSVRVGFPDGLLTEFYPPVAALQPPFDPKKPEPLKGSTLDWGRVWIIPEDKLRVDLPDSQSAGRLHRRLLGALIPQTSHNDHYGFARETDSALVYVERPGDPKRPIVPRGTFLEKFLFYRGVGNFDLPITMSADAGGRYRLANSSSLPLNWMFLVTVDGEQIRYQRFSGVQGGQKIVLTQSPRFATIDELSDEVVRALQSEGLYEKEARSMVKTWRTSWFGEQGTRLFYALPREFTDAILPLEIEPRPDETVRVMVGRLEIMRPEDEARVIEIVQQSAQSRSAHHDRMDSVAKENRTAYPLPDSIIALGRLAEPALARIRVIAGNSSVGYEAARLQHELRMRKAEEALKRQGA